MRLGSLIVATYSASVRAGAANSAKRASRSPAFGPVQPPSCISQRGIVKWTSVTSGFRPALAAAVDDPAVVVEGGAGELALLRLDPAPLEAEPVGVQPGAGHEVEVLAPAVVGVAGVAAGLGERRVLGVLQLPVVVVDVAALDLVGGGGGAPEEAVGEGPAVIGQISSRGGGTAATSGRRRRRPCGAGGRRRRTVAAAPGDVLVGADEDEVGAVERPEPGQVAGRRPRAGRRAAAAASASGARRRRRGVEPEQREAVAEQVVQRRAVGQPGVRQAGARVRGRARSAVSDGSGTGRPSGTTTGESA